MTAFADDLSEETDGEIRVTAELPGLQEKDFEVSVSGDALVLKGEKHEEREDRTQGWHERSYGTFGKPHLTGVLSRHIRSREGGVEM
jgi:HSP20 family protein